VTRDGDRVAISFTSKDYCDVTIWLEDADGEIVRHLASGVLGPNAPAPLTKNSLKQTVIWDGKDELGRYVDDKDRLSVHVALGLKPHLERTLYWCPSKRCGDRRLIMRAAPEGVYVLEDGEHCQLRLYDHEGNYLRTVYPFPADKLGKVRGLKEVAFPPDGGKFPVRWGLAQSTFLTAGRLAFGGKWPTPFSGSGITSMVVRKDRIYLLGQRLNRLATDGSTGGLRLGGAATGVPLDDRGRELAAPLSAALSPDGKWIYTTAHFKSARRGYMHWMWLQSVHRLPVTGKGKMGRFAGVARFSLQGMGRDDKHFAHPTSVDCDARGRVYVSDYYNNRIQVYSPGGSLLRTIPCESPAFVRIDPRRNRMYVFSWWIPTSRKTYCPLPDWTNWKKARRRLKLTVIGPLDKPRAMAELPLPGYLANRYGDKASIAANAEVDVYADPPVIWLSRSGRDSKNNGDFYRIGCPRLYTLSGGKLKLKRDFGAEYRKALVRTVPPSDRRQRLYVNPATGHLYIGEYTRDTAVACKSFYRVVRIDPATGKIAVEELPTDPEDMGFDCEGRAYLRTYDAIVRFDPKTWREIPFDYGEQRMVYNGAGGGGEKKYRAISAVSYAGDRGVSFILGGMGVSPRGDVVITAVNPNRPQKEGRKGRRNLYAAAVKRYVPRIYPGRPRGYFEMHLFDRHGKLVMDDVAKGLGLCNGVFMDNDRNLYVLAGSAPILNGKLFPDDCAGVLFRSRPGAVRIICRGGIVPPEARSLPDRPPDLRQGFLPGSWLRGVDWALAGAGQDGQHRTGGPKRHCRCVANSRSALDYFRRSFVPELYRYSIAVVDTAGNLIMRFGRYGNVDDGVPLVREGGPPRPRPIGGSEVALFDPKYLAVDGGKRLFVADMGNDRILSVRLGYHRDVEIRLSEVPDRARATAVRK
jgi:hypothetical protein